MKQLESSFLNMALVLTVITLIAAGALASVYTLTEEPIRLAKEQKKEQAIKDVLAPYTRLEEPDTINGLTVVRAYNEDAFVGAAVESSAIGFGGTIRIMIGFDKEGKIFNYSVLEQAETPGLGTKIVDWFKTNKGKQDIRTINPSEINFTVTKDGGAIDAITAATISSRAFLEAVTQAYAAYAEKHDADITTGASQQHDVTLSPDSLTMDSLTIDTLLMNYSSVERPIGAIDSAKKTTNQPIKRR